FARVQATASLSTALLTTRDRQINQKKVEWREKNSRTRVSSEQCSLIASRLPGTTLFDFLWRLRTRSDYRDARAFLEGVSTADEAVSYLNATTLLCSSTLAVLETIMSQYVGSGILSETAD